MEDGTKDGTEPEPEKVSEEDETGTEWPITRPEYAEIDALHLKDDHVRPSRLTGSASPSCRAFRAPCARRPPRCR